jgi:hypothetical protein
MVISSYIIKAVNNVMVISIINLLLSIVPAVPLIIYIGFILDKFIIYKVNENEKTTEIRYLKLSVNISYILLLIVSSSGLIYSAITFISQIALFSIHYSLELVNVESVKNNTNLPCELYNTRKKQLLTLTDLIQNYEYDNYAISLNGCWGSGKSEMLNALVDISKEKNYYCVYIKPLISDTQESLLSVFKDSLSQLMKENGIYSGKHSSLDKYFKEVSKLIQFNDKLSLSEIIGFESNSGSFRDIKKQLQSDINSLLYGKRKLLIIIDDFDRIDSEKQLEILSFVKEIIDFKGCIIIIAFDYKNIKLQGDANNEYLEKFIGTKINLVEVEFNEIISFYAEKTLKISKLESKTTQEIAKEVLDNIYGYNSNIEERLKIHRKMLEKSIENETDGEINKNNTKKLNEFDKLCLERNRSINNSRRAIHFLNEIYSTLKLVDQLYIKRIDNLNWLVSNINVSEIIYIFNYIKVFDSNAYNQIVNLNGIEEYINYLENNGEPYKGMFYLTILGKIIPELNYDENNNLIRNNALNFIKDIFINYYFTKNNIDFITESEKTLKEVDDNTFNTSERLIKGIEHSKFVNKNDLLHTLQIYQDIIIRDIDNPQLPQRVEKFVNYLNRLCKDDRITFNSIFDLLFSRYVESEEKLLKCYLETINNLIIEDEINEKGKTILIIHLNDITINLVAKYKHIFIVLLTIIMIGEKNEKEIKDQFEKITNVDQLYSYIKEYCLKYNIFSNEKLPENLKDILDELLMIVKSRNYKVIPYEHIESKVNQFYNIHSHISELVKIAKINNIKRDYKSLLNNLNYFDINQIKSEFNVLSKEEHIDDDMLNFFHQLIKHVVNNNRIEELDNECKDSIKEIFNKVYNDRPIKYYEWADLDISIYVERIINFNVIKNNTIT